MLIQMQGHSLNEVYMGITRHFQHAIKFKKPIVEGTNHGEMVELRRVTMIIDDPRKCVLSVPYRNASRRYMAGEFACYLQERASKEFAHYGKLWGELDVDGEVCSNYGRKMFFDGEDGLAISRYDYAIAQLAKSKDSKNAVIMMRDWRDNRPAYQKDRCCTLSVQLIIRNNKLEMDVHMRSSDFWMGVPYDIFWFSFVQQRALAALRKVYPELKLGSLLFEAASLHVYRKHFDKLLDATFPTYHCPADDYRMPEWTQECEDRLLDWLLWEKYWRNRERVQKEQFTGSITLPDHDTNIRCHNLRDQIFPPFLETVGSFLVNKITPRYPTDEDVRHAIEAYKIASQSQCIDRKVGCVLVGSADSFYAACNKVHACNQQCDNKYTRICHATHAEIAALELCRKAADKPTKAYVTLYPCRPCMEALLQANPEIEIVVFGFSHKGAGGHVTLIDRSFIPPNREGVPIWM